MRSRWVPLLSLGAGLLVVGWGALWIRAERRFQTGLDAARARIASGQFEGVRIWLSEQSVRRPEHAEVSYLLGICEDAAGRPESALNAWARVPLASRWGLNAAEARARLLIHGQGRFADAEAFLTVALTGLGPRRRATVVVNPALLLGGPAG